MLNSYIYIYVRVLWVYCAEGLIDGLRLRCGEEIIILRGYAETMRRITLTLALRQDGNHIKYTNGRDDVGIRRIYFLIRVKA